MRVEPNCVYVIPRNTNMAIANGALRLTPREETRGQHRPIDYFMRSLAEEKRNRAIGVILSGTASDGTLGLGAINAEGGFTFAQDEKTAKYDGMPHSAINAGCIDFVLPPEGIAEELVRLARQHHFPVVGAAGREDLSPPYGEPGADGASLEEILANSGPASAKLSEIELRRKLHATREYLRSVIEQHEAYAEELQSANEELQSSNEELQSVSEELETAKQELQLRNEQLKQDKEKLRLQTRLIELSAEPIFIWDFDEDIIEWNQGCERLYGYTSAEAIGRNNHELLRTVYPLPLEEFNALLAAQGEWAGELRQTTKDGREVIVESRKTLTETDGRRLVLETNRDITARKQAEDRLRESEERFRVLADSAPVLIWVTGADAGCDSSTKPISISSVRRLRRRMASAGSPMFTRMTTSVMSVTTSRLSKRGRHSTLRRVS